MLSFFLSPARLLTSSRSNSCLSSPSQILNQPSPSDSKCAVADPDAATMPDVAATQDDLRLLHPPLQLVLLSNDTRFCSLTRAFLHHAGFAVFTCTNSDRAESLFLNRSDLQLWIIDVQALGIEAVYFATRVREQHPAMPILLILSDHAENRSLRQFLLHGWTQLTKPVDLSQMLTTINNVMSDARKGSTLKHYKSDGPLDPFEPEWLNDFSWPNPDRMRN
jgi:CheY-like chemotaxis protein